MIAIKFEGELWSKGSVKSLYVEIHHNSNSLEMKRNAEKQDVVIMTYPVWILNCFSSLFCMLGENYSSFSVLPFLGKGFFFTHWNVISCDSASLCFLVCRFRTWRRVIYNWSLFWKCIDVNLLIQGQSVYEIFWIFSSFYLCSFFLPRDVCVIYFIFHLNSFGYFTAIKFIFSLLVNSWCLKV